MGKEAQSVAAAGELYNKANHILGYVRSLCFKPSSFSEINNKPIWWRLFRYDLVDVCVNGPKEKLDSTVISQVHLSCHLLYLSEPNPFFMLFKFIDFPIFSQPAIYVTSLAAVELLRVREGGEKIINSVDVTCGLSLGEYTALAFAGAFRLVDLTTLSLVYNLLK